jgi:hypothetical protein
VGVGWSVEGGLLRWCEFNASVLTQEGRRRDEALPEDKAGVVSSALLNGKKA